MEPTGLPFPALDPVAFVIPFYWGEWRAIQVRWYGLAYMAGLILGWLYMRRLISNKALWGGKPPLTVEKIDDFLLWATLGVVIGGRLGFVLLYEPKLFIADPQKILYVWSGGMAFHGGLLGVILAILLFARATRTSMLSLGDLTSAAAPLGLFFGRVANFINAEIYGKITTMPWGVWFPIPEKSTDVYGPRHPTQLYEAFLEGVVIFALLRFLTHRRGALRQPGLISGAFLIAYAASRIFVEFYKEWDGKQFFTTAYFSEGMVYSLPMIALGLFLILRSRPAPAPAAS